MGFSLIERNLETSQARNLGDASEAHLHGKIREQHGIGILLNKKWRNRIKDSEYINERAITTTIMVNHRRIKLMSVHFHHPGERVSVGPHTLKEVNKRGDWMKQWLMIQKFTALDTMYRKTLGKQTAYRSPKGTEKQIDYILIKRRLFIKAADASDMIHMDSDHRMCHGIFHDHYAGKE